MGFGFWVIQGSVDLEPNDLPIRATLDVRSNESDASSRAVPVAQGFLPNVVFPSSFEQQLFLLNLRADLFEPLMSLNHIHII